MFALSESNTPLALTTRIIQRVELSALLSGSYETTEIPFCPTQAISGSQDSLDARRCIACGICRRIIPDAIEYHPDDGDVERFTAYCRTHKMFVYRWLSMSTLNISGVELFIRGFSRTKRVPFVSLDGPLVRFCKCAHSVAEVDAVKADLTDMANLASDVVAAPLIERSIVLIRGPSDRSEREYINTLGAYTLFDLAGLHKTLTYDLYLAI